MSIERAQDKEVLKAALVEIVNRHEVLRTSYRQVPGVRLPVQVIGDLVRSYPVIEVDASEAHIEQLQLEQRQRTFNLEAGTLLNLHLLTLSDRQHYLLDHQPPPKKRA